MSGFELTPPDLSDVDLDSDYEFVGSHEVQDDESGTENEVEDDDHPLSPGHLKIPLSPSHQHGDHPGSPTGEVDSNNNPNDPVLST